MHILILTDDKVTYCLPVYELINKLKSCLFAVSLLICNTLGAPLYARLMATFTSK